MKIKKAAIITGVLGGIGSEMAKAFRQHGYHVIGLDVVSGTPEFCDEFFQFDLNLFCSDFEYRKRYKGIFLSKVSKLNVLINNAAIQILGPTEEVTLEDWNKTMNVNLTGALLLSQLFIPRLKESQGSIINIASIHQQLTKRNFVAYSTSKSALVGLTKAMSVDLGGSVRVNCISPAAIHTQMLLDGFNNDESKIKQLNRLHPLQRIGRTDEVSRIALLLAEDGLDFINGANIQIDGGISNVLKDLE